MKGLLSSFRSNGRHVVQAAPAPLRPCYVSAHSLHLLHAESQFRERYSTFLRELATLGPRVDAHLEIFGHSTDKPSDAGDLEALAANGSLTDEYVAAMVSRMGLVMEELFGPFVARDDLQVGTLEDRLPMWVETFFLPGYPLSPPAELCSEWVVVVGAGRTLSSPEPATGRDSGAVFLPDALDSLLSAAQVSAVAPGAAIPTTWIGSLGDEYQISGAAPLVQWGRPLDFLRLCHDVGSSLKDAPPKWTQYSDERNHGLAEACESMGSLHAFGMHLSGFGYDSLTRDGRFVGVEQMLTIDKSPVWPTQALAISTSASAADECLDSARLKLSNPIDREHSDAPWVSSPLRQLLECMSLHTWFSSGAGHECLPRYIDSFVRASLARRGFRCIDSDLLDANARSLALLVLDALPELYRTDSPWAVVDSSESEHRLRLVLDATPRLSRAFHEHLAAMEDECQPQLSPTLRRYQRRALRPVQELVSAVERDDTSPAAFARRRNVIASFVSENRRCNPAHRKAGVTIRANEGGVELTVQPDSATARLISLLPPMAARLVTASADSLHRADVPVARIGPHSLVIPVPTGTDAIVEALLFDIGAPRWLEPIGPWFIAAKGQC